MAKKNKDLDFLQLVGAGVVRGDLERVHYDLLNACVRMDRADYSDTAAADALLEVRESIGATAATVGRLLDERLNAPRGEEGKT